MNSILTRFLIWLFAVGVITVVWNTPHLAMLWDKSWSVAAWLPPFGFLFVLIPWFIINFVFALITFTGVFAPDIFYAGCDRWTPRSKKVFKSPIKEILGYGP